MSQLIDKEESPRAPRRRSPKPTWIRTRPPSGEKYLQIKDLLKKLNLVTVCQEALCPNMAECWQGGTATVMLLGDTCTRGCRFCSIKSGHPGGVVDKEEPEKVADALSKLGLTYIVLTSVDRDDLDDGGASHFAKTIRKIKEKSPKMIVEVLTSDYQGNQDHLNLVVEACPDVYAQNVETVERLTRRVRDRRAGYWQTLNVLKNVKIKNSKIYTKTSIMLGLGETDEEVLQTLKDLRGVDCDVVTFGQYLQPTPKQLKVEEFVTPEKFKMWQECAEEMGFLYVASGPLVRSSYKAGEFFMKGIIEKQRANGGE